MNKLYPCVQTPPPDDYSYRSAPSSSSKAQPWFPVHSSSRGTEISYQCGGLPTFNNSISGDEDIREDALQNQWETSYGMRVDVLSAFAYILGPISGKLYKYERLFRRVIIYFSFDITCAGNS